MKVRARVSSKGQVTIPKAIRDALGICEGTLVEFDLTEDRATLRAAGRGFLDLYGSVTPRNRPEDWSAIREEVAKDVGRRAARNTRSG